MFTYSLSGRSAVKNLEKTDFRKMSKMYSTCDTQSHHTKFLKILESLEIRVGRRLAAMKGEMLNGKGVPIVFQRKSCVSPG